MPGYPSYSLGSLQVAFYVQQPLGLFIGNLSVLPRGTLAHIVITEKAVLETAIGANISDIEAIEAFAKPTTPTPSPTVAAIPAEPSSNDLKWIVIGASVGAVVICVIIVVVFWW